MVIIQPVLTKSFIEKVRINTLHKLGYDAGQDLHSKIEKALDEAILAAERKLRPQGIYFILPVLRTGRDGVQVETGTIRSIMFTRLVDMCRGDRSIVFMIATLGEELEKTGISKEPLFRQAIFHTVWSELAEAVADMVEADWRGGVHGLRRQHSFRFSPGYCDWSLEGQVIIFKTLNADKIGVRLTSHFVMIPRKSISAVAVLANEVPVPTPCAFCTKRKCHWRRLPCQPMMHEQESNGYGCEDSKP